MNVAKTLCLDSGFRVRLATAVFVSGLSLWLVAGAQAGDGRIPVYQTSGTYVISAPGSYYLTENMTFAGEVIRIDASNVFLDLSGFAVTNTLTTSSAIYSQNRTAVRVTNGKILGGAYGARFITTVTGPPIVVQIDHVTFVGQASYGIVLEGLSAADPIIPVLEHNLVAGSGGGAYYLKWVQDGRIEHNVARGALAGHGFLILNGFRCSVNYNIADGNNGNGIHLSITGATNTNHSVSYNIASNNAGSTASGIAITGAGNMLVYNTASNNGRDGILVMSEHNTLEHNTMSGNVYGMYFNNLAHRNSVNWNSAAGNTVCGIRIVSGSSGNIVSFNRTPMSATCGVNGIDNQGTATVLSSNLP